MESGLQRCGMCQEWKSPEEFVPSRRGKGNGHPCTPCGKKREEGYRRAKGVLPATVGHDKVAYMKQWHKDNPEFRRAQHLRRYYDMTLDEYQAMLNAQKGVCKACGKTETRTAQGTICHLHVDHDHKTGRIRGLLCNRCNMALGYAQDDPNILEALASYIREHLDD